MPSFRLPLPRRFAFVLACFAVATLEAAPRAIIVVGLSTSESQAARLAESAATVRAGLLARGLPAEAINVLAPAPGSPVRREDVFAALAKPPDASPADETWILLFGSAAAGRDGQPAFQVSGPRLSAANLAAAVAGLPGKKFVVVATSASGGFLPPLLSLPDVEAVAATGETGEISEPRFAAFWADALRETPAASFAELAASAAQRVADHYGANQLAQSEHARLVDRAGNRILEAPFPAALVAAPAAPPAPNRSSERPPLDIASLEIPRPRGTDEIERRPADDASRALLAAARAAADPDHAATILQTEAELLVARDFSARETWRTRAYLRTGEALDELGTLRLPAAPPFVTARLLSARVVRPDGAQLLLNPAARAARLAADAEERHQKPSPGPDRFGDDEPPPSVIELPEVTADCVVEAEWVVDRRASGDLPEFSDEWSLAAPFPQRAVRVTLTLPRESRWRAYAPHLPPPTESAADGSGSSSPAAPAATSAAVSVTSSPAAAAASPAPPAATARTLVWTLANLPAREPMAGDPPAREFLPWIGVSSLASWEDFAAWYRRIAVGSETAGAGVEALAAEIAAAHPDRAGRLRAAYERVAALRYVALELGVGGLRPRTPEQVWRQRHGDCKDKANLLVAVLVRLGIPARFALVNRFDVTYRDFPAWQFNHALALVPADPAAGQPHDLWLDSTDRLVPFGVIAPGDLGRAALVFEKNFASAAFRDIGAAQEPAAEWRETYSHDAARGEWRVEITAAGSAETRLRRLLDDASPARRRERLRQLLAWPGAEVLAVTSRDPYDLAAPHVVSVTVRAATPPPAPRPLVPGLDTHLARVAAGHAPLLWDEGRDWRYLRTGPGVSPADERIPGRRP